MNRRFDVVIIGGGNAGFGVSSVVAEAGRSIAFIEEWDFGGTCPNRGCTPKKVLVAAAHAMHEIELAGVHGIRVGAPHLDWAALIGREREMVGFIPEAMAGVAEKRGTVFRGHARFVGPNRVAVGDAVLEAEHIVIATGSRPRSLPIPGAAQIITSDEVLSQRTLPQRVVFIGGGVIAMEFSHVYARAGAQVTILEALPRLLPRMDADAVAAIQAETARIGIGVKTDVSIAAIHAAGSELVVEFVHEGKEQTINADRIVNGTGRVANVEGLDLDAGDVKHDGVAIELDETLRSTSNPAVWVCGDALVGSPQLSPLATYEGQLVGRNIVSGAGEIPDYSVVPSCVYTVPALASVGLTEAEAREQGLEVNVVTSDMTGWFSGKSYGETVAWSKVLVEPSSDRVVGAHIVGHSGEELVHLFAFAMAHGITASSIKKTPVAFPTFSSDIRNML